MSSKPPTDWGDVALKDICELVQYGYTASAEPDPVGPKFLRITDIVPSIIDWNSVPHCRIDAETANKYKLQIGDIVIARTGATTGFAKRINRSVDAVFASYLVRLRLNKNVDDRYIGLVIESDQYKRFIKSQVGGAAQPNANAQVLVSFQVSLPPLLIQRKIASILSAYDDLIENNMRRIKILEEMAQAIYREWFVNFRFPGHEKVQKVESELGPIPEGWSVARLRDICERVDYGYTASAETEPIGPKFLRITDIVPAQIDWDAVPYCRMPSAVRAKYLLQTGDIVVARTGATTGYAKWINKKNPHAVFASYLVRLRIVPQERNRYVGLILESDEYKRFVKANWSGAAQPQANAQILTSMKILLPDSRTLAKFDQILTCMLDQKEILQVSNSVLRRTRDFLLSKLISGEVDVSELEIKTEALTA